MVVCIINFVNNTTTSWNFELVKRKWESSKFETKPKPILPVVKKKLNLKFNYSFFIVDYTLPTNMESLNFMYCHLCFYIESKDKPIIKLACNHTICIVCNTEIYCALCRLSKYFLNSPLYSLNCSYSLIKCSMCRKQITSKQKWTMKSTRY